MTRDPAPGPALVVGLLAGRGRVRLVLEGELDLAGAEDLQRWVGLARRAALPLEIDCGGLAFVDCAGLGALLDCVAGGATIHRASAPVRRLFDLVGLHLPDQGARPARARDVAWHRAHRGVVVEDRRSQEVSS